MFRFFTLVATFVSLLFSLALWTTGEFSPKTGPYWYFYAASAAVFAILYTGTKETKL